MRITLAGSRHFGVTGRDRLRVELIARVVDEVKRKGTLPAKSQDDQFAMAAPRLS